MVWPGSKLLLEGHKGDTGGAAEEEVECKRRDHTECRDYFRRRDNVIDRVRVGRVQPIARRGDKSDQAAVLRGVFTMFKQAIDDEREQQRQRDEESKYRKVKPEWLQSAESIGDREQRRNERAVGLIARERTESRRVPEEKGDVAQRSNGRVIFDAVRVIEVEAVLKMVPVSPEEANHQ